MAFFFRTHSIPLQLSMHIIRATGIESMMYIYFYRRVKFFRQRQICTLCAHVISLTIMENIYIVLNEPLYIIVHIKLLIIQCCCWVFFLCSFYLMIVAMLLALHTIQLPFLAFISQDEQLFIFWASFYASFYDCKLIEPKRL